jgi:hypothetical protein
MSSPLRYSLLAAGLLVLLCAVVVLRLRASAAAEVPHIEFSADNVGPRDIEDLTGQSVPRDYGFAWQTMEQALDENRPALLDGYFTGLARQDLKDRVSTQHKNGLRTHYEDRGHKVEAFFYAPGGDAMELHDHVQMDVQILDGSKVIYEEPLSAEYVVLMTPGADRWLIRQIQALPSEKQ